jgi:hypothetical protein
MGKTGKNTSRQAAVAPTEDQTEILLRRAHERLDQLWTEAIRGDFTGEVGIKALFQRGAAQVLRRHLEGTDK